MNIQTAYIASKVKNMITRVLGKALGQPPLDSPSVVLKLTTVRTHFVSSQINTCSFSLSVHILMCTRTKHPIACCTRVAGCGATAERSPHKNGQSGSASCSSWHISLDGLWQAWLSWTANGGRCPTTLPRPPSHRLRELPKTSADTG